MRKQFLLRVDPELWKELEKWAADELRSVNAQIELLLRDALRRAGRLPRDTAPMRPRGRPRRSESAESADSGELVDAPAEPGPAAEPAAAVDADPTVSEPPT